MVTSRTFWHVCIFILVTELCERFAFYGLTGSLTLFLQTLCLDSVLAVELTSMFSSLVYVTPVLGAYLADAHWGRYKTILFFCILYLIGLLCTTASAWPTPPCSEGPALLLPPSAPAASPPPSSPGLPADLWLMPNDLALVLCFFGLFCGVALGAGGIKSNVVVLGADQFELPAQTAEQDSYFRWFYWSINIGATVAFTYVCNLAVNGQPPLVPQAFGFFASFVLPTAAFALGISFFFLGRKRYKTVAPQGSAVSDFVATVRAAAAQSVRGRSLLWASALLCVSFVVVVCSFFLTGVAQSVTAIGGTAAILLGLLLLGYAGTDTTWLHVGGLAEPDGWAARDAADVVRVLPLACCLVMFWCVYSQMSSTFQLMGCQMDLNTLGTKLSPATLNVFDSVIIMALIPVVDRLLYPMLACLGCPLSMLGKIGVGFGFAAASMFVSAYVEVERKNSPLLETDWESSCPALQHMSPPVHMSSLSIWWQVPQFMLIGFGEIFTAITSYELFYSQVPEQMRSVCQSINLLCTSFGALAAAGLDSVLAAWIPKNLNDGHLEYVFLVLGGLMVLNLTVFALLARRFEYSTPAHVEERVEQLSRASRASGGSAKLSGIEPGLRASGPLDYLHSAAIALERESFSAMSSAANSRAGTTFLEDGAERGTARDALLAQEQGGAGPSGN